MSKNLKEKIILIACAGLACTTSFYAGRLSITAGAKDEIVESVNQTERPAVKVSLQTEENGTWSGQIEGEATLKSGEELIEVGENGEFDGLAIPAITVYNDLFEFTSELDATSLISSPEAETANTAQADSKGTYVASKNGTKYHPVDSGTAKRIKDENKVFFDSKAEAEAAGYEPGSSVK